MNDNLKFAKAELAAGRNDLAIQFCGYVLAREPDQFEASRIYGLACLRSGRWDEGIDMLERVSLCQPLDHESRIELAIAYGSIGRKQLSRDLLMAVATSGQLDASGLLCVAAGLEAIDEPRLAMEACRQAGQMAPDQADVHYLMGRYASACGHPPRVAEALIRHAIDLEPDQLHYRIGLASLLIRLGRKCEAITVIDRFIPARLDEVTCHCCLIRIANLFFDCDDLERAKLCSARLAAIAKPDAGSTDRDAAVVYHANPTTGIAHDKHSLARKV